MSVGEGSFLAMDCPCQLWFAYYPAASAPTVLTLYSRVGWPLPLSGAGGGEKVAAELLLGWCEEVVAAVAREERLLPRDGLPLPHPGAGVGKGRLLR